MLFGYLVICLIMGVLHICIHVVLWFMRYVDLGWLVNQSRDIQTNGDKKFVCLIRHIIMSWYVCVQKVLHLYSFLEFFFINLRIVNCFVDGKIQRLLMGKLTLGCIIYICVQKVLVLYNFWKLWITL